MKYRLVKILTACVAAVMVLTMSLDSYATGIDRSYTYNYDYWGDVQDSPDLYSVAKVFTSTDLGLDVALSNPSGVYVHDNSIFIMDSGNNRILEFERESRESLKLVRIIDSIKGSEVNTFLTPTDMAISEEGNYFIADKGNGRIVKTDKDLNFITQFLKPVDNTIESDLVFQPSKIAVDPAERVYCVAVGINKGLIKYENDGSFTGFVGATKVVFNFTDYLYKKIASQEQLKKMESFVPTEYDGIYIDDEGFFYACTSNVKAEELKGGDADSVRRLNLLGNDILIRNGVYYDGDFPVYGDLYMGSGGGYDGPSKLVDVTAFPNNSYVVLDKNRGRLFGYDEQGRMIFVCGGAGNMDGYFRTPVALDHIDRDLVVVDQLDCSISMFTLTEFGELVFNAMDAFDDGQYSYSKQLWEEVIAYNGNYDLAYIGIGRAYLRQKDYKTAMDYFELKYDAENYSKAYKQYRKQWVEDNIAVIVIVLLAVFLIPMGIGKVKQLKFEIAKSDAFKYNN